MGQIRGTHEQAVLSWPEHLMPGGNHVYLALAQTTFMKYVSKRLLTTFVRFSTRHTKQDNWPSCTSNLYAALIVPSGPCTSAAQTLPFLPSVFE